MCVCLCVDMWVCTDSSLNWFYTLYWRLCAKTNLCDFFMNRISPAENVQIWYIKKTKDAIVAIKAVWELRFNVWWNELNKNPSTCPLESFCMEGTSFLGLYPQGVNIIVLNNTPWFNLDLIIQLLCHNTLAKPVSND